uniref:Pol polyprotein n=1 Tax=Cajanus cajan TaxID=3821 RepID=A0A151SWC7_CAJCA|nr:Pol polyprotein [Cajanus cajan]
MDILNPFLMTKGQLKFLIVAVDLFTKWIEVEPLTTISEPNIQRFTWKNILTRFGIPYAIITDNGLYFTNKRFNKFLMNLNIKHKTTSVEHPQSNRKTELANKVILSELKKRLGLAKGAWVEQLPKILWAYRCTPKSSMKEAPFRLTFGNNEMILIEIGEPLYRRVYFHEKDNYKKIYK